MTGGALIFRYTDREMMHRMIRGADFLVVATMLVVSEAPNEQLLPMP